MPRLRLTLAVLLVAVLANFAVQHLRAPKITWDATPEASSETGKVYAYHGSFTARPATTSDVIAFADDCLISLKLNGKPIIIPENAKCQLMRDGIHLDWSEFQKVGKNEILAEVKNLAGPHYLQISPDLAEKWFTLTWYLLIASILLFFITFLRIKGKFNSKMTGLWFTGMSSAIIYAELTRHWERAYDYWGHIEYFQTLAKEFRFPSTLACWQCYHPPLYYFLMAPLYSTFTFLGPNLPVEYIQLVSTVFFGITLAFGIQIFKKILLSDRLVGVAMILALALPSTLFNSARIGNDSLLATLWMAATYYLMRWEQKTQQKELIICTLMISLGLLTKGNALVLIALLGVVLCEKFLRNKNERPKLIHLLFPFIVLCIGLGIYFWWSRSFMATQGLTGNIQYFGTEADVDTSWKSFLGFSMDGFLYQPALVYFDEGGRQFFWNYWLETALLAEWTHRDLVYVLQPILALSLLLLIIFLLYGCIRFRKPLKEVPKTILISPPIGIIFAMLYRWQAGKSCSTDFRYVYPIVFSTALIGTLILHQMRKSSRYLFLAGALLTAIFVGTGLLTQIVILFKLGQ